MDLWQLMEELEKISENASALDENRKAIKIRLKGGEIFEVVGVSWDEDTEIVTLMAL